MARSVTNKYKYVWLVLATALLTVGCSNRPFDQKLMDGNTYFFPRTTDPVSLDPSFVFNTDDDPMLALVYPSYFRFAFLQREPFREELNLGERDPKIERINVTDIDEHGIKRLVKGERWTFTIRRDARFQDDPCFAGGKGRQVVANDIVYAFKRMADPKVNGPMGSFVADKIVGFKWYAAGFASNRSGQYDVDLPGVKVDPHDPFTFSVTLNQPYPQLRYIMAFHFSTPQAREAVETYGDAYGTSHPVGCGLFKLEEFRPHAFVSFVKSPNAYPVYFPTVADPNLRYLLGDAGKRLPFVDRIFFPIITEPSAIYSLIQQGYLDSFTVTNLSAGVLPSVNKLSPVLAARGLRLNHNKEISYGYIGFNMRDSLVGGYSEKQKKLRQAISLSIDSKTFIQMVYLGMAIPAEWILPPGLVGYDPNYRNPYRRYDPSLKKAKQLLGEAGYPNGIDARTGQRLVLHLDGYVVSPIDRTAIRLYQKMIQALGIQVELRTSSYDAFVDKTLKGQIELYAYGYFADYPDAEDFTELIYGPNIPPGNNLGSYDNPEYNCLYEQMRGMTESPARQKIIERMRDISVDDCPLIYVAHAEDRSFVQPWTSNLNWNSVDYGQYVYMKVDPVMRHRLQAEWNRPILWPIPVAIGIALICLFPAAMAVRSRTNRRVRRRDASRQ